jgi:excisionase family DNA binding protein
VSEVARVFDFALERQRRSGTEPWLSKQQLAGHLGFSVRWVELRVQEGMPHRRMGGRVRFQRSTVEDWLERSAS